MPRSAMHTANTNLRDLGPAALSGARVAQMPAVPKLMLATSALRPPNGEEWLHEIKFDGYRVAATLDHRNVRLTTRNQLDWTTKFPAIAKALEGLPIDTAIIDGEVVALGVDGRTDFGALQRWLGDGWGAAQDALAGRHGNGVGKDRSVRVLYQAFDLLYLAGNDVRGVALEERKSLLAEVLAAAPEEGPLRFTEHLKVGGEDVFAAACPDRLKGEGDEHTTYQIRS